MSNHDTEEIKIKSLNMYRVARKRNEDKNSVKRLIRKRGMRFAQANGNCCWGIKEKYNGGETKKLLRPHTYYLPRSIRSVKVIEC